MALAERHHESRQRPGVHAVREVAFPRRAGQSFLESVLDGGPAGEQARPKVNALEPGTTATDMTADFGAGRSVAESALTVVRLATLGADGPTGTFTDEFGTLGW